MIAAWLKTEDLTQRKISKWEFLSISKEESQEIDETFVAGVVSFQRVI